MAARLALIDSSAAMRVRIQHFLREDWPDASVEEFDPGAALPQDAGDAWHRYDAVIVGFIEHSAMALELALQLKPRPGTPPVLFLASREHQIKGSEAFLTSAKASLPRETLSRFDLRDALYSLLASGRGNRTDTAPRALTAHLRVRASERTGEFSSTAPIDAEPAPRIALIDGAYGRRTLIGAFLRRRWPNAVIDERDPFGQCAPGALGELAAGSDLVIAGGIGSNAEALGTLACLHAGSAHTPVILLVGHDLEHAISELRQAGAGAVLLCDSLSARELIDTAARLIRPDTEPLPADAQARARQVLAPARGCFTLLLKGFPHQIQIERYRSLARLAASDLCHVFRAERIRDRKPAVIKVMNGMPIGDRQLLAAFIDVYGYLSSVEEPSVVKVLDSGIGDDFPYMVFEYLGSGDLRRALSEPVAPRAALRILGQLADALAVLHRGRLAHLDLKPENVFFRDDGSIVLIDFMFATRFGSAAETKVAGEVIGTPYYMSPEHGQGLPVDGRSDLYSAGVIFYEMLTAQKPFNAESAAGLVYKHIHDEIPLLPRHLRAYQSMVDRLMAKQPEERYQTAEELALVVTEQLG